MSEGAPATSPRAVFERLVEGVAHGRWDELLGRVIATGRRFTVRNVFVLRVRDGLIVESRDHADHLAFAAATGRLPSLVGAEVRTEPASG